MGHRYGQQRGVITIEALMDRCLEFARTNGITTISLEGRQSNRGAHGAAAVVMVRQLP
jgi:hypothetical protein